MLFFKPSKTKLLYIFGLMKMHLIELEACVIFLKSEGYAKNFGKMYLALEKYLKKNLLFVWSIFVITT